MADCTCELARTLADSKLVRSSVGCARRISKDSRRAARAKATCRATLPLLLRARRPLGREKSAGEPRRPLSSSFSGALLEEASARRSRHDADDGLPEPMSSTPEERAFVAHTSPARCTRSRSSSASSGSHSAMRRLSMTRAVALATASSALEGSAVTTLSRAERTSFGRSGDARLGRAARASFGTSREARTSVCSVSADSWTLRRLSTAGAVTHAEKDERAGAKHGCTRCSSRSMSRN
mmetsp:Transcript_22840/g.69907  ORF Transcript_22840/g.69907 Transcript_22840/m.69907 type:complete len:238 (-) Transcript_22840:1752-2465(-)